MIIKPTVGRVVWYRPNDHDLLQGMHQNDKVQPFTAHVVYVWNDYMVNLVVFDHNGTWFVRTSVPLRQEDGPTLSEGTSWCEWMPYQIGQAKKHEGENNA